MVVAEQHPSSADLEAFALGTLDNPSLAAVEVHVAGCPNCQERAAGASGDSLIELLRRVHTRTPCPTDTVAEAAAQAPTPAPVTGKEVTLPFPSADSAGPEPIAGMPAELARHERYRVVRLLGEGGMGSVFEAEHRVMQRLVALKVIHRTFTANPAAVERFRREVRAAARLAHPNIVTAYDAENAGETHFLVMEYIEGVSLARLVKERGPLPVAEACEYVRQAALGLQHAHERGMVHRDVKPENLIRCADGTVKVLDFGLAALTAERGDGLTEANVVMGTPDYMAPEQAEDPRTADGRADVYSLGCTLYYLLTARVPYPAPTPLLKILAHREQPLPSVRQACPEVPPELAAVVARMLAKKPENRYQTPGEVAAALEPFARLRQEKKRRGRWLLIAAAVALLLAATVGAGVVVYRIQTDNGELVITTESDDVEVVIKQGGKVVRIIDTKTDKEIKLVLRSGTYELELTGAPEGLKLNIHKATLTRGGIKLAKIERVAKSPVAAEKVGEIRRFEGHTDAVPAVAFSADGRRAVSGSNDATVRLWDLATGKELRRFEGHTDPVTSVALSADGRRALSASKDGTARLWDTESGKEVCRLQGHTGWVWCAAFAPDARCALTCCLGDGAVRLWDLPTGKELRRFEGHGEDVKTVAFSPDGRRALSGGGSEPTVRLWDVDTGKELRRLEGHTEAVRSVAFSPDGRRALSGGYDRTLRLWDLETGKELRRFEGHTSWVHGVAFTPDGRRVLSGNWDGTVRLWDAETGQELYCFNPGVGNVEAVAVSPDGRRALIGGWDRAFRLWRLPDLATAKDRP
ncbi:MAG TPA: protein kinase [Gemmataceae bacterium]|nr:protein kinase [Gemmataceae bacterium]